MIFLGLTLPAFLFGTTLAILLGAVLHLWQGGNWKFLMMYVGFSWLGFWIGHFLGKALNWTFLQLGPVMLGMALLGAILALAVAYWIGKADKFNL